MRKNVKIVGVCIILIVIIAQALIPKANRSNSVEIADPCFLPILGEFYLDVANTPEVMISLPIIFSENDSLIDKLCDASQVVSIKFQGDREYAAKLISVQEILTSDMVDGDAAKGLRYFYYYTSLDVSNIEQDFIDLNKIEIITLSQKYSYDIGSIIIHLITSNSIHNVRYSGGTVFPLVLEGHLGGTLGIGLKRYDVTYSNRSSKTIYLTNVELGRFENFPYKIELDSFELSSSDFQAYPIEPGKTIDIIITFDTISTPYYIFLLSPLLSFTYDDETIKTFTPYATNGGAFTGNELKFIFDEVSNHNVQK